MPVSQGDIVLVRFPFTDLTGFKKRPAIIISNGQVHRSGDCIIVQLTTRQLSGPLAVQISDDDVTPNFKPPYSTQYVYCKKIATVDMNVIIRKISQVTNMSKLDEILSKVNFAIERVT